ncbi:MAG: TonB-dependent receptor [Ferruginibacter sp.]
MMKVLCTGLLLFLFHQSYSQQTAELGGNYKITGAITDSVSKQPVEYATISIVSNTLQKTIDGSISTKAGFFQLKKIPAGWYTITIQCIGYNDFSIKINLKGDAVLTNLALTKKVSTMQGITVTINKGVIENKIDKIIFNVDKDITSQSGMATDALKKIPQVSVDVSGNVELLGNPSVRFLINGKPSGIFGNSPADALQSIPASQIQSIEVITSPTAKYDASGTGGIINIILKKSKVEGFNGNINLAAGTRLENASISSSLKKNNFGVNAYFSGNLQLVSKTPVTTDRLSANTGAGNSRLMQESETDFSRNGYKSGFGFDWSPSKKDNLSGSIGFNHFENRNTGNYNQSSITYNAAGSQTSIINSLRAADTKVYVNTTDNEMSYKRKFNKEQQELEFFYTGSYSNNNTFYNQHQQYQNTGANFAGSNSLNPGKENETELGINYAHPFGEDIVLETGIKTGIESIISSADVYTLNTVSNEYIRDLKQSFQSNFKRNVYAAYASLSFPLYKIFDVKAGLRYEYTSNNATYSNAAKTAIPDYKNTAPSIIISHSFKNNEILKFGYSYRLERPDFRDLNPFMNLSDPHNITTGNPNLQPEIGHIYELTFIKTYKKGANINVVVYTQRNSPDIKPYITYYPSYKIGDSLFTDVTITTRATIAAEVRSGLNLSVTIPVSKQLSLRSNILLFNRHLNNINDTPAIINGLGIRSNLNVTYQFSKSIAAEAFGNYMSGMKWQGKRPAAFSYTMAIRKQFKNTKGSIGFVAVNPFNQYINQKTVQQAKGFVTNTFQQLPYRSFGISFAYKFGKLKFSKPKESDNYLYTPPSEN